MRNLTIILLSISLTGCISNAEIRAKQLKAREDYIAAHPKIKSEFAEAIRAAKIRVGMSKDDVKASWGTPCWYCHGTRQSTWGDTWEYNIFGTGSYGVGAGTYVFFDDAGRVRGVSR